MSASRADRPEASHGVARRRRRTDGLLRGIAWRLPRRLAMWGYLRVVGHALTGRYEGTVPAELDVVTALARWEVSDGQSEAAREDRVSRF